MIYLFTYREPILSAGRILKQDHLRDFSTYPRDIISIMYDGYGNGVLEGCDITVSGKKLTVHEGIIIYNSLLYYLVKPFTVQYDSIEVETILKVRFFPEDKDSDFKFFESEIVVDNTVDLKENEMELCRFKLKRGAELRTNYQNFEDMLTEYDTAHLINVLYTYKGGSTISPKVTFRFANEAFLYKLSDPLDLSFCFQCLQNKILPKEMIFAYLNSKFPFERLTEKSLDNAKIYELLARALFQISKNRHSAKDTTQEKRRVLVD